MRTFSLFIGSIGLVAAVALAACGGSDSGNSSNAGGGKGGGQHAGGAAGAAGGAAGSGGGAAGGGSGGGAQGGSGGGAQGGSGGQNSGQLKPGPERTVQEYCTGVVAGFCDKQYECCGKNDAKRQACMQKHVSECVNNLNKQLSAGTVEFHGEYADACAEEMKGAFQCKLDLKNQPETPNCDAAVQGKVQEGGACTGPSQCVDGLKCSDKQNKAGVCYKPAPEGQPCGEGCASGLVCINGTCSQPLALGAQCTAIDQCGQEAYCEGVKLFPPGGQGVCKPRKAVGEPCNARELFGMDCQDFFCDPATNTCSDRLRNICEMN